MKKILGNLRKAVYIFVFLLLLALFFPLNTYAVKCGDASGTLAGECPAGEDCSCVQAAYQNCNDNPANNTPCIPDAVQCACIPNKTTQEDCFHTICPVGWTCTNGYGPTSYCIEKTNGGAVKECPWSQSNCPPGTIIDLNQPLNIFAAAYTRCPAPGTAQRETGVCSYMTPGEPRQCGDWYNCPTANNPSKMCRDCTEGEPGFCASREIQNYGCKPIVTPTPPIKPTLTPTPIPTRIPIPLKCESLKGELGGPGGVAISSTNATDVKYGDKILFTARTTSNGQLVKSMTFQITSIVDGVTKILLTQDIPAKLNNGIWLAQYEYLFSTYGKIQVQVTAITPQ